MENLKQIAEVLKTEKGEVTLNANQAQTIIDLIQSVNIEGNEAYQIILVNILRLLSDEQKIKLAKEILSCEREEFQELVGKEGLGKVEKGIDLEKISKKIDEDLENITQEEIEKFFPRGSVPKGWVSIEEHLPMFLAEDIGKGGTEYKCKDAEGNEYDAMVSDHNIWYYMAKEAGITHWFNPA